MGVKRKYCERGVILRRIMRSKLDRLKRGSDINIETASAY